MKRRTFFFPGQREITQQSFQPGSPATGHTPPSRRLAVTTYGKSLDSGAIFASQKYFLTTLVLFDWSWVYAVPGTGRAFSSSARFLSALLQPSFNSGLESNPQNYLSNCSFWPKECHPVSSEGLSQRPCCSGRWYPSGMGHCQPRLPHPPQPWGLLGDFEFPQLHKQALRVWDAFGQGGRA